jgi:transcriptional regulator with XRE-family HTH domain
MGERIRKRRENLGIQSNDLANSIGVTSSLISQIERAKAFPSILTLKKIADALQTTVGELIGEHATFMENPLMKANERKFAKKNRHGASVYLLSHHDPQKQMDPFIIEFKEKGNSKEIMTPKNPRQEFCFVLKGSFKVQLGEEMYTLNQGDSFYFYSNQHYLFTNISEEQAQLLWVVNQQNN